ncbi:DUF2786 domain-containing protein [Actinosynnema sp. NPDC023587]|uniref:DUF2786 domain-containing protein n=1 Tax=Actinosynnema sp. NPDC023587 TaxID=3154695 RepID=UPI0033D8811D
MTTSVRAGADHLARCHRAARDEGLAPALTVLRALVLPGLLPCGPGGHAVVPQEVAAGAHRVWLDGVTAARSADEESAVDSIDLPGGTVVLLRHGTGSRGADVHADQRASWSLGLVWLRLGLSEALRETCMRYLNGRRTGSTTVLQQQMVKSAVADGLIEHLEVRAVLTGAGAGDLPEVVLAHLHTRVTAADRLLVNLLGASGYLTGGPGQAAHVSELVAEAYVRAES